MARLAILLREGDSPTKQQARLSGVLDFFSIPWKPVNSTRLSELQKITQEQIVFGSIQTLATALEQGDQASRAFLRPDAFYAYADDDLEASGRALNSLCGHAGVSLRKAPGGILSLRVSREWADLAGPMAGLEASSHLRKEDAVLVTGATTEESRFVTVVSAAGAPVFFRFKRNDVPVFLCASSYMVDIDEEVGPGFYDVKDHFCSALPLVMFLRYMFPFLAWRPQELGACLIVDDPLLRNRYGCCDFGKLRALMQRHAFTTNIAFIPWNWCRTSNTASEFFGDASGQFSVSIHGCDHIGAEFGTNSLELLHNRARLAQSRMRSHEARTGIHHDPIMIFPQGVFSSVCPEVLKRHGFLAAVNTETVPVDRAGARTRIREVWDVAITAYSGFPIFPRRYAFHGLENFAFDLLLGKPCLIASHHDFFKNGSAQAIELIEKLQSLNCCIHWRPLGEVIRRACRRRVAAPGVEELEMYGNELLVGNASDEALEVRVKKRENQPQSVAGVFCDDSPAIWAAHADHLEFGGRIPPRSEALLRVAYRNVPETGKLKRPLRFELSVAARRVLSEFRDEYLSRSRFLTRITASLRNAPGKAK